MAETKIQRFIKQNKFLYDPKYHKNNYWSWAAWDSSAARGYAGGCSCCRANHYNASLRNKRVKGGEGRMKYGDVGRNICATCVNKIEEILNVKFLRNYVG